MQDTGVSGFHHFSSTFSCRSAVFIVEKAFSYPFYGTGMSGLCTSGTVSWCFSHPGEFHDLPWHPVMGIALTNAKKHFPTI